MDKITPEIFISELKSLYRSKSKSYKDISTMSVTYTDPFKTLNYLRNYTSDELKNILLEAKKLNFNQLQLFYNVINFNTFNYTDSKKREFSLHKLDREIWRIKKGMLNKKLEFMIGYGTCSETIRGFIRAFKTGTIFSTKINIDGELRRVFIKTSIGSFEKMTINNYKYGKGIHHLILDPKTMSIYNLSNSIFKKHKLSTGRINLSSSDLKNSRLFVFLDSYSSKTWNRSVNSYLGRILKKEIKKYVEKHKENTSFEKRHNIKKPNLFSKIKKKVLRK